MFGVVISLLSGLFHAGWNIIAKDLSTTFPDGLATWLIVFASWGFTFVLFLFDPSMPPHAAIPWLVLSGVGEAAYTLSLGKAYSKGDLAISYAAIRSLAMVLIWPISYFVFSSTPTWGAYLGTALVLVGITRLYLGKKGDGPMRFSAFWSFLSAISIAAYHTGYKGAMAAGAPLISGYGFAVVIAATLSVWPIRKELRATIGLKRPPNQWVVLAGALATGSFLLAMWALRTENSGLVLSVRNSSIAFAAVFAYLRGEKISRADWFNIALIFVGTYCFAL